MIRILIKILCFLCPIEKVRTYLISISKSLIIKKHQKVSKYIKKYYLNDYLLGKTKKWDAKPLKPELVNKKIIWQFWGQGINKNTPLIVKACLESVKKHKKDYKVIILTNETIKNYITLPSFLYNKLEKTKKFYPFIKFKYPFFSDILRSYLLSAYGGIWIDATIFMTDKIPQDLLDKDFFMFQRSKEIPVDFVKQVGANGYWSWDKDFKVKVLNSFIISKPNNNIINTLKDILVNYWVKENRVKHYFIFQILFDDLIKLKEYKNCEIISDLESHFMVGQLNKPYSTKLWNEIISKTSIHKLTYRKEKKKNTILSYILSSIK